MSAFGGRPTGCVERKLTPDELRELLLTIAVPEDLQDGVRAAPRDVFGQVARPAEVYAGGRRVVQCAPLGLLEKHHWILLPMVRASPALPMAAETLLSCR